VSAVSLSPQGSRGVVTGSIRKGLPVMLLGGVLAWVSGQSWSVERGAGEFFQLLMAYATLVVVAIAAQFITGPRGRPWMLATAGSVGLAVPWFLGLAITNQGQGAVGPSALVLLTSFALTYAVSHVTRALANRWTYR
jgi:hypothetical protein